MLEYVGTRLQLAEAIVRIGTRRGAGMAASNAMTACFALAQIEAWVAFDSPNVERTHKSFLISASAQSPASLLQTVFDRGATPAAGVGSACLHA